MLIEEKASGVTKLIPRCKAGNTTRDKEDYFMIKRSQHVRKEHQLYTCRKENTQSNSIPRSGAVGTGPDNTTLSSRHLTEAADSKPARSSDCREL